MVFVEERKPYGKSVDYLNRDVEEGQKGETVSLIFEEIVFGDSDAGCRKASELIA